MALQINKKDSKTAPAVNPVVEEKVETKAPVQTEVATEEPKSDVKYGSARGDLAFVCPLGDPSNPDTTKVKLPDGNIEPKVTSTIVGYKFKVLKDMEVPECGTNEGFKNDPMNHKEMAWRAAKAGEIIALTPFETALLLSQPQFNGGCDGGEKPVSCVYQNKALKSKTGQVATVSAATAIPRVSLRASVGSIKDFDIEDVLSYTKTEVNGVVRKVRTINPGFEKWSPLAATAVRKTAGGSKNAVDPTTVANKNAQAFLAFVNNRK